MEQARSADQGGVQDLDGFITQLAQLVAHEPKESHAATLPEAADVIRLMTIHHAKGLEFPLVVLPDLDRPPRFGAAAAALHPEFGPLVPMPSDDDDHKKVATGMSLYAMLEKFEELEERKRLLYVAVTRAADYLILSSSLQDYTQPRSDWMTLLGERFDLETGETLAELPQGYRAPRIHLEPDVETDHKPPGRTRGPDLLKVLEDAYEIAATDSLVVPREVAPIAADGTARRQLSFSRLTGQLIRVNESGEWNRAFDELSIEPAAQSQVEGRALGILVHEILARIDFNDLSTIGDWCEHLASQLVLLNTDEACRMAEDLITRFVSSPRGQQIAAARAMHREVEFILSWPPNGHAEPSASGRGKGEGALASSAADDPLGPVYLRGYIDCLYSGTDGRWRIADYKTNDVSAKSVPAFAKRYAIQLYVYAMAAEQALGEPPSELAVYFMKPGVEHVFPWNDAVRQEAITMVDTAIKQLQNPLPPGEGRVRVH
jgi:ATP-dependent helicase/nuclease subunit A